ncbi:MAG: class B sortase [Clostridia bacterium]|nr:class B sortase [Clostridia bacterium]
MKKDKKGKKNKFVINLLIVFSFSVAMVFLYLTLMSYLDKKDAEITAAELQSLYHAESATPAATPTATPTESAAVTPSDIPITETPSPAPDPTASPVVIASQGPTISSDFKDLLMINNDVAGWISISGTHIDYPVLLGDDNEFYLKRDIYKKETRAASIFMDYRNNVLNLNKNTILYGHNLEDGTMFSELTKYVDHKVRYDFIKENNIIVFNTIYENMKFEIFSAYVEEVQGFQYLQTSFKTDQDFLDYVDTVTKMSLITTNVKVNADDKILTLSTCNHWFLDSRTVIHARLITD